VATDGRPRAETTIDEGLVETLLLQQHPDLADLSVRHHGGGWDNEVFRLGERHAVRMPRRSLAAGLVEGELRWLPPLARRLPLLVPAPVRRGRPGAGYPWPWSITPWLPGDLAARVAPENEAEAARALGAFVRALGVPAPADAPGNPFRGVPLADRHAGVQARLAALPSRDDRDRARRVWARALAAPVWVGPPVWLHGDLHPANLLVDAGRLSAVLDFGDLTAGDPATDLSVAWMLFAPAERETLREAAGGCDQATWDRARGNALAHALACLSVAGTDPVLGPMSHRTLGAVLDDSP
jgi:aminoglycoside phosphotransferase (APT) family kinase protein